MLYQQLKFPENSLFLVTGAAGFIGSNLCEAILEMGYRVRALDDLSTGGLWLAKAFLIVLALQLGLVFARILTDINFRKSS